MLNARLWSPAPGVVRLEPRKTAVTPGVRHAQFTADEFWTLELTKTRRALEPAQLARVESFVQSCLDKPTPQDLLLDADKRAVLRTIRALWSARTRTSIRGHADAALLFLKFIIAALLGAGACALAAGQIALEGNRPKARRAPAVPLMHAEISTRTRHLLSALARDAYNSDIVIIGRPKLTLARFHGLIQREYGLRVRCCRCYRSGDVLRALMATGHTFVAGFETTRRHASNPDVKELAGIFCRRLLGEAAAAWWSRESPIGQIAVYAHTGTADTSRLERAQQRDGVSTVHVAHGVSHGANFSAVSDIGLFQCAHDARWHEQIGGYGRCIAIEQEPPRLRAGNQNHLLVLSNLIHPMNASYRRTGADAELRLIRVVTAALERVPQFDRVFWRFHPAFEQAPAHVRTRVLKALATAGIEAWPALRARNEVDGVSIALSTPSTAAIDMLRLGVPTVICAVEQLPSGSVYHQFETVGADPREIEHRLADPRRFAFLFSETWRRIGPGAQPSWSFLSTLNDDWEET